MTTTFEDAKIGDKAWCMRTGWGEIREVGLPDRHSIAVHFPNAEYKWYTVEGYYDVDDATRSLFWDEVKIVAPQKPLPNLDVDAKVLVWTDPSKKHRRHFSHFKGDRICTFDGGATSFSMLHRNSITSWPYWELAE